MASKFESHAEAHEAVNEYFVNRNMSRGQYPKRIKPNRMFLKTSPDGTNEFLFVYKGETVKVEYRTYDTVVTFYP